MGLKIIKKGRMVLLFGFSLYLLFSIPALFAVDDQSGDLTPGAPVDVSGKTDLTPSRPETPFPGDHMTAEVREEDIQVVPDRIECKTEQITCGTPGVMEQMQAGCGTQYSMDSSVAVSVQVPSVCTRKKWVAETAGIGGWVEVPGEVAPQEIEWERATLSCVECLGPVADCSDLSDGDYEALESQLRSSHRDECCGAFRRLDEKPCGEIDCKPPTVSDNTTRMECCSSQGYTAAEVSTSSNGCTGNSCGEEAECPKASCPAGFDVSVPSDIGDTETVYCCVDKTDEIEQCQSQAKECDDSDEGTMCPDVGDLCDDEPMVPVACVCGGKIGSSGKPTCA